MNALYYDIESLENVFTVSVYQPGHIDIYYMADPSLVGTEDRQALTNAIGNAVYRANKGFRGSLTTYDLHNEASVKQLARLFGASTSRCVNWTYDPDPIMTEDMNERALHDAQNPGITDDEFRNLFRPACDTDPDYDEDASPYLFGYNSYNYDTTMLAHVFDLALNVEKDPDGSEKLIVKMPSAHDIRAFNNKLFGSDYIDNMSSVYDYNSRPYNIRRNMLMTNRNLDVARLNEKQKHLGLKRILGMLGYQILEDEKVSSTDSNLTSIDEMASLLAYNCSDCIGLEKLMNHPFYDGQFQLKKQLLVDYPELIYAQQNAYHQDYKQKNIMNINRNWKSLPYQPEKRYDRVRTDRIMIDSSSAQFATKILCPYGNLTDMQYVDYTYPASVKINAEGMEIDPADTLEKVKQMVDTVYADPKFADLRAGFNDIYRYYKDIEGSNFDDTENYSKTYGPGYGLTEVRKLQNVPKTPNCMFYYDKDGNPTSSYVNFSYGGIHGAEYNKKLFDADHDDWQKRKNLQKEVEDMYPDPIDCRMAKEFVLSDGVTHKYTEFLKSGATKMHAVYKDIDSQEPKLFTQKTDGSEELNAKYAYTSAGMMRHADFSSYYPNLLQGLDAFKNTYSGVDKYAVIYQNKQEFGKRMKDKSLPEDEREHYRVMREGTKLILNSASGAANATFANNIRMDNRIITMRIVGQLFAWRIGQSLSLAGAETIPSTNTDGLYSVFKDGDRNKKVLDKEEDDVLVNIEQDDVFLISKDANNRIEADPKTGEIWSAKGGTVSCRKGPVPSQALSHPAIVDWALAEYLVKAGMQKDGLRLDQDFNREEGMKILKHAADEFDDVKYLNMFQNVIASSTGSCTYIYGIPTEKGCPKIVNGDPNAELTDAKDAKVLQHFNRVFIMKDGTDDCMYLREAVGRKTTPAMQKKRAADGLRPEKLGGKILLHNPNAVQILNEYGVHAGADDGSFPDGCDAMLKKVTNIPDTWYMHIENHALDELDDETLAYLKDNLDLDKYLDMVESAYSGCWQNQVPDPDKTIQPEPIKACDVEKKSDPEEDLNIA